MSTVADTITDQDLPALYRSADSCSLNAQNVYLWLVIADLASMVLGGLVTAFSFGCESLNTAVAICGGTILAISCVLTWVIRFQRFEKVWYGGRAVAESVKTLAWKFAVRALPFDGADSEAESQFVESLQQILTDKKYLGADLGTLDSTGEQITSKLREVRAKSVEERRDIYLHDRIENQRKWYASKAGTNRDAKTKWFTGVIIAQLVAAGTAFASVRFPNIVGLPPVVASVASALLAWLQVKQHQEHAQAYGIAAHELGLIVVRAKDIHTDQDLSDFVQDAENAISREHTLWIARRDHLN